MLLLLTKSEISKTTIVGENVERDKYVFCIEFAQDSIIEPLLGSLLYDKIITDYDNGSGVLEGLYLELYTDFINPILKYSSVAEYIETSNYILGNKGLMMPKSENSDVAKIEDRKFLADKYKGLAQKHVIRFEKWIKNNSIDEYQSYQDDVNPQKIENSFPWKFD